MTDESRASLKKFYYQNLKEYLPSLRDIHSARHRDFDHQLGNPVRSLIRKMNLGMAGERLLTRLDKKNEHLVGLVQTLFDYAIIARKFRNPKIAELEQVSGARQKFYVITMPGTGQRKQLMYDLTSRIVDAESLPVNLVIVSSWARTGWNVITPNLLIDATASRDVTAWQQLRGRAIRAWKSWTNECYLLETILLNTAADMRLDASLLKLLKEIAPSDQYEQVANSGLDSLSSQQRHDLALSLMKKRNKITHVYELIKSYGAGSQVTYDRDSGNWQRKEAIAIKHAKEISVNPFTGVKSKGDEHAPLVYREDPRSDLPQIIQEELVERLKGSDDKILNGWLGDNI